MYNLLKSVFYIGDSGNEGVEGVNKDQNQLYLPNTLTNTRNSLLLSVVVFLLDDGYKMKEKKNIKKDIVKRFFLTLSHEMIVKMQFILD